MKDVYLQGSNEASHVANVFADHFKSVYYNSANDLGAKAKFENFLLQAQLLDDDPNTTTAISVELVDSCVRKLKLGKASGPDGLSAEHIVKAHPVIIIHLCLLYRSMIKHCIVPDDFGKGIIVPLIKDNLGNPNDVNNYRGITLIPVISKLFEIILVELRAPFLHTDNLQFGF